jgi:hypothetical protein
MKGFLDQVSASFAPALKQNESPSKLLKQPTCKIIIQQEPADRLTSSKQEGSEC